MRSAAADSVAVGRIPRGVRMTQGRDVVVWASSRSEGLPGDRSGRPRAPPLGHPGGTGLHPFKELLVTTLTAHRPSSVSTTRLVAIVGLLVGLLAASIALSSRHVTADAGESRILTTHSVTSATGHLTRAQAVAQASRASHASDPASLRFLSSFNYRIFMDKNGLLALAYSRFRMKITENVKF